MEDEEGVRYFASSRQVPDLDAVPADRGVADCALCGQQSPVVVRDVGNAIIGKLAVARWWPLCHECAHLAHAGAAKDLARRARSDLRIEGWETLVADALVKGQSLQL